VAHVYIQGDQKVSVHLTITVEYTIDELKMTITEYILNVDRIILTQFGVSINVCRLAGDTLNITCKFLYCNNHVHRDFLTILYNPSVSRWPRDLRFGSAADRLLGLRVRIPHGVMYLYLL
jgi:hypothetical protein